MIGIFNNREIAIAFWTMIFFVWALSKRKIRRSILNLTKSFLSIKIIIPLILLLLYSSLVVLLLRNIHIWKLSNLKETIYWFIFSGAITAFRTIINDEAERPFRKIIRELVTVIIVIEFIVNTYIFSLPIELFFIPMVSILTVIYTYSSLNTEYKKVEHYFGTLLAIIGIIMIVHALAQIFLDFNNFKSFDTLIDFILPVILTISIIPATYLLMLYASYESFFTYIDFVLGDSMKMKRYAKKLLIFHCNFRISKMRNVLKCRVTRLYDTVTKEDIRKILLEDNIPAD